MRLLGKLVAAAVTLVAVLAAVVAVVPPRPPRLRSTDWAKYAEGPAEALAIGWVGHGLMNARDAHADAPQNVIERVSWFAEVSGLPSESFDHTLDGAPLSLLWRGRSHSPRRPEPSLAAQRAELLSRELDALVLTETVPVGLTMEREHSSYYLQRFYCAFQQRNPEGRVYLYESWLHLRASDSDAGYPPPHRWDWGAQLRRARQDWERLADEAMTGAVVGPTATDRLAHFWGRRDGGCRATAPIFLIPVATVMGVLANRLRKPHDWTYRGRPMDAAALMRNPYSSWPPGWPTQEPLTEEDAQRALARLSTVHEGEDLDDLHPSDLGVYVAALTSFAVIYRRSPLGLPTIEGLSPDAAREIQRLVWGVVQDESRAGVAPR